MRSIDEVLDGLGPCRVLAVDGRSNSGKTTTSARIATRVSGAVVVHTDDVAWYHDYFDWVDLLTAGVLDPVRRGAGVDFRPPEWDARERPGSIVVPADCPLVILEGVGAGRHEFTGLVDAILWVQTDRPAAIVRGIHRDGWDPEAIAFIADWERAERPFVAAERPWERAALIVAGAPDLPYDPTVEVVVADPPA